MASYNLGTHSLTITTASPDAQIAFDQGLNWTYGFNHEQAVRCYQRALAHDPDCAMAHWGVAYASGPNYNMPWVVMDARMRAQTVATCHAATQSALALVDRVTAPEAALIRALPARTPHATPPDDLRAWDSAFADAMRAAHHAHPDHPDIRAIFVESMMNRTPWKMWDLKTGQPAIGADTVEAKQTLETALPLHPDHPGLLHLYVHLMEMSPTPERALPAADTLRELVPDAGHLVHMPTHIDILCGHYHNALIWNEKAIAADLKYYHEHGAMNLYTGYRQHNYHFAIYAALFLGQMGPALRAVRGMADTTPEEMLRIPSPPMADYFESYLAMEPHVLIRFGQWQRLIDMTPPDDPVLYATLNANLLYGKSLAHAALGDVPAALRLETEFLAAAAAVPPTRYLHNNRVVDLLQIAREMLRGEILYRQGDHAEGFAALRRSVALDDALPYDEPWGWMQPARHALGALLFEQGHLDEAEQTFRADLGLIPGLSRASIHPDNVWALKGLYDCLTARGETTEIVQIKQRLDLALARADTNVAAACFCAQAALRSCCSS